MAPRKVTLAEGVELWQGDFREVPLGSFDHLLSDPPYEQRSHNATGSIRRSDGTAAPSALSFSGVDLIRADLVKLGVTNCTGWMIMFCTTEGVAIWRDEIELHDGLKYKTPLIWVKPDAMPKFNGQGPSHGHECMVTAWCGPGYSKWNGGGRRGVFTHPTNSRSRHGEHETEKPVPLMSELVLLFTNPGDIVCDPCMGSGTTGVACVKAGRGFVGVELNERYFDIACERIDSALKQGDFFVGRPRPKQERLDFNDEKADKTSKGD